MLRVKTFTFNAFQENTYLIINDSGSCWIVDPGMYDSFETKELLGYIAKEGLNPVAVVNTHAHLDHIFGVEACKDAYKIPFHVHQAELPVLKNAKISAQLYGFQLSEEPKADHWITPGFMDFEGEEVEIRLTPGHSPGSVVFYYKSGGWCVAGDVLFQGSIGRTDLPGGNHETLMNSISSQMLTLPDDTIIYPGHGPSTTINDEKRFNPFLQDL